MSDLNNKSFEIPLLNGFHRVILKGIQNRLISVYYITPNNQYLRNTSDVFEWITKENKESLLSAGNFSFVVRKYTSHSKEYFKNYNSLSLNIKDYLTQKTRALRSFDLKSDSEDKVLKEFEPHIEYAVSRKRLASKEKQAKSYPSKKCCTLSKGSYRDTDCMPKTSFHYLVSIFHKTKEGEPNFLAEHLFTEEFDGELTESLKSFCGNHCCLEGKCESLVTFKCNICSLLWHLQCIGYNHLRINNTVLVICDNCYLLERTLKIKTLDVFYDVESLISKYKAHTTSYNHFNVSEPKLMFKMEWLLENMKKHNDCNTYATEQQRLSLLTSDGSGEILTNLSAESSHLSEERQEFPTPTNVTFQRCSRPYKYVTKLFITPDNIIHNFNEDYILYKYNIKDVLKISNIFADRTCEMRINHEKREVHVSRITVRNGNVVIPVSKGVQEGGIGLFYTYESNQEEDSEYFERRDHVESMIYSDSSFHETRRNTVETLSEKCTSQLSTVSPSELIHSSDIISNKKSSNQMVRVNKRRNIDKETRGLIIDTLKKGIHSKKEVATMFALSYSAIINIFNKFSMKKGEAKGGKLSREDISFIRKQVTDDCEQSLADIQRKLNIERHKCVSLATLTKHMYPFTFTIEASPCISETIYDEQESSDQNIYSERLIEMSVKEALVVFVAETSVKLLINCSDIKGEIRMGKKEMKQRRFNVVTAMSTKGIHYYLDINPDSGTTFEQHFLEQMLQKLSDHNVRNASIMLDKGLLKYRKDAVQLIHGSGHEVVLFPSYHRLCNPIESLFSHMKDVVYRKRPKSESELIEVIQHFNDEVSPCVCKGFVDQVIDNAKKFLNGVLM